MDALLIIDMQKDFCYKDGSLYISGAEELFRKINKAIDAARKKIPIIFTQDWHRENDSEFKIWPKHCIMNTRGAEIVDELRCEKGDYFVKKRRYSAFFATDLDLILRELSIKKLYLCGVATNICVMHTAADAVLRNYSISLIKDCTKALSDYDYEYAIKHMQNVLRAEIVDLETFTNRFK